MTPQNKDQERSSESEVESETVSPPIKSKLSFKRIFSAFQYSMDGLRHAAGKEAAFQQELMFLVGLTLLALLLPISLPLTVALIILHLFVLVVELLNTGLEAIVDKASPEIHELAKQAKDMGSAAVFVSFVMVAVLWCYALYEIFI